MILVPFQNFKRKPKFTFAVYNICRMSMTVMRVGNRDYFAKMRRWKERVGSFEM
jgi:hypothetical protein